ncbi:alpha/beta fold hydrolase [Haloplanus rubicundus]|uniref:Alpha/beta hydrolase n=1 Tax=Haloplanus rubicundus TaxID=1547898 RepID=A0A345ECE3_9EURY|nr:alpha/beta hydrolase [Haloplanus rubicundus]AXG09865.1 alpha/beta hydrolase [Haloplanus rubicundus]
MDAASPPPADRVSVAADRHVAYAEYGDPTGRPVLFLHGTPGSRRLGQLFDAPARREGVRIVAPDRPGYGASSPWPTRDLTDTGAFVAPVLDDAGVDRAGVVGFSGGGPHALALAATHADRVTSVDVVAGATPPDCPPTPRVQRLLGRLASTTPRLLSGLLRVQAWLAGVAPAVVVSQYAETERVPDEVASLVARDFVDAVAASRRGAITELRLLAASWDLPLASVDRPVRLRHGTRDANVPIAGARALRDRLPDARLTAVEDADHLTALLRSRAPVVAQHAD